MVAVGEAAAVVMTGVANWLIGWDDGIAGTDGTVTCGDGPGTEDDLRRAGLGGSSAFTALCWCIFFKLPFEGLPWAFPASESMAAAAACFGLLL